MGLRMRVDRYNYHRRGRWLQIGCGCLTGLAFMTVMACALVYTFSAALTPLVLRLAGIENLGRTDALFADITLAPTPAVLNPIAPPRAVFSAGEYGDETLNLEPQSFSIVTGSSDTGSQVATATFTEAGLLQLCNERSAVCSGADGRYRNAAIDLRPGGAVIYVDVRAELLGREVWQRIGVVLRLDAAQTGFDVIGVDVDGITYDPTSLPGGLGDVVGESINEIENTGNDVLRQLVLEAAGQRYVLSEAIIDHTTLTLVMR